MPTLTAKITALAARVGADVKALTNALAGKEPTVTGNLVSKFYSGTKTWRDLATDVRAIVLTGLSVVSGAAVEAGDTLLVAIGKLQKQCSDLSARTTIGPVSQSGGVSTGALMEYGSNASGQYWKFANGLMICTRSRSYGLVIGDFTIYGSIWYYYGNWTFPVSFAAPPVVTGGARGSGRVNGLNADPNTTESTCNFFVIDYTSPVATTVSEKLVAVGRWF